MKQLKRVNAMALAFGTLALAGGVQAAVEGASSNTSYVKVGASDVSAPPFHTAGLAGISVQATDITKPVDFQGLSNYGTESNDVYTLNFPYSGTPEDHDNLGVFNFAQVGSSDVWFGEWSAYGTSDSTRTVYYSGADADTSVPSSGTATYSIVGINNYDGTAGSLLSGTFTADFGAGTLEGTMASTTAAVNIGTTTINSDASVTGTGTAAGNFNGTLVTGGDVSAQFYNGQADLAGLVDFSGTDYDTAFGGARQ